MLGSIGGDNGEEIIKVFVYGTLMRGRSNHWYLRDSIYLGDGIITGYALYDLGSYPGVVASEKDRVKGELYSIDKETLKRLDDLEEEGDLYLRQFTQVALDDGKIEDAYIYVCSHPVTSNNKVEFGDQPWGKKDCQTFR
jgi:gamma-glutamylcyclotransferase (GGCT)/AIG2-like uncharacterized protein YtfP